MTTWTERGLIKALERISDLQCMDSCGLGLGCGVCPVDGFEEHIDLNLAVEIAREALLQVEGEQSKSAQEGVTR